MMNILAKIGLGSWIRLGLATLAALALAWVVIELRAGARAAAEVARLEGELTLANAALEAERDLLDRRTNDMAAQIRLLKNAVERAAEDAAEAAAFEDRIQDFGPAVPVPPLVERTLREVFP
ncbi:hypothetical protein [Tabrizicola soli]|uniref:DUF2570 domain-containing protein n=1 Tax=Tabrizicola soli TaxID=2185115 RepID=A0ABV7DZG8_9RHOB|nr:hypothetical protein [Tabrizicola soli]